MSPTASSAPRPHPLDPLGPDEIRRAAAILRESGEVGDRARFSSICLEEPEVWDSLDDLVIPRQGRSFICNCGPKATPEAIAEWIESSRLS